jgi:transposase
MGYASDLRDEEWAFLESLLEPQQKDPPRKNSLRSICNAIRYVQRTGCQLRLLPRDIPPWLVVYMTSWRWRNCGV